MPIVVVKKANLGYVVDKVEGADLVDGAVRGDGTYGTDGTDLAQRMNALFYFYCLGHHELKNKAHNGLWRFYAVTVGLEGIGRTDGSYPLDSQHY